MKTHLLKIDPELFGLVEDGLKTAEIRWNDRDFQVGDLLEIYPYDREKQQRVGQRTCMRKVTHILHGGNWGIEKGYVVLSMQKL